MALTEFQHRIIGYLDDLQEMLQVCNEPIAEIVKDEVELIQYFNVQNQGGPANHHKDQGPGYESPDLAGELVDKEEVPELHDGWWDTL